MRRNTISLITSLLLALITQQSHAGTILFQEDFETRTTTASITSFSPTIGDSFSGSNGIVSVNSTGVGGPNIGAGGSAKFVEGGDPDDWRITPAAQTLTSGDGVTLSFDFWLEADTNKYVDIAAISATNTVLFNVPIYANGTTNWYHSGFHPVTGTFATGQWLNYRVIANLTAGTFDAVVGGLSFSGTFPGAGAGTKLQYIAFDLQDTSNYFFYDNPLISVPEPASMSLLAASGALLLGRRKAHQRSN